MLGAPAFATLTLLVAATGCWRSGSAPGSDPAPDPPVRVASMPDLLAALRSSTTIALAPGDYQIDEVARVPGPHHRWANVFEGTEYPDFEDQDMLVLEDLHDVTLRAEQPGARPRLVTGIASATVLVLRNCTNVTLQDLSIGHSVEGTCGGGVVTVLGGSGVRITGCDLSGSGTFGVEAYQTTDLRVARSRIFHTSEGAVRIFSSDGAAVVDSVVDDNTSLDSFFFVHGSRGVTFERLEIRNNRYQNTAVDDQALFKIGATEGAVLRDAQIVGNSAEYFLVGDLATERVAARDNTWVTAETGP